MPCPPSLQLICQKLWLKELRHRVRLSMSLSVLQRVHSYLAGLPCDVREEMLHVALSSPAAGDTDTRDQLANNALLLLGCDVVVRPVVYLSLPRPGRAAPADLQLALRHGDGLRRLAVYLPEPTTDALRLLRQLLRVCRRLLQLQVIGAVDAVLSQLGGHCPDLRQLDVSGAGSGVTDVGVTSLAVQLSAQRSRPALRRLNLQRTDVTQTGVFHLLNKLPQLEYVGCNQLIGFLEDADVTECTFNLRQLTEFQATESHLSRFSRMCPFLTTITIVLQEPGFSLQQLASLPHLQHLSFHCRDPYIFSQADLERALWQLGSQLRTLVISGDIYDCVDVAQIALNCTSLEVLKLPSLTCSSGAAARALNSPHLALLSRLRVFEYDCMTGVTLHAGRDLTAEAAALRAVLCRGRQLRVIRARPFPLVDGDLKRILRLNPLSELELFEVGPAQLGSQTARDLILGCPSLRRLGRLKLWHGLELMQIVSIRSLARGRCHNAEIRVC